MPSSLDEHGWLNGGCGFFRACGTPAPRGGFPGHGGEAAVQGGPRRRSCRSPVLRPGGGRSGAERVLSLVSAGVEPLVLAGQVILPVLFEVPVGGDCPQGENGLGAVQAPPGPAQRETIGDEMPAGALDDTRWDDEIRAEGDEALALTGKDVGTPIIHFDPPEGTAFFGPVISRLPAPEDAVRLWDHVTGLASFPGFAELKRSLRERVQLRSFGVDPGAAGAEEDWHAGRRKTAS